MDLCARLWVEAVRAACLIINFRSSKHQPGKLAHEIFPHTKLDVFQLCIFGTPIFIFDTHPSCEKLDACPHPYLYLSLDTHAKGFRCFDPLYQLDNLIKKMSALWRILLSLSYPIHPNAQIPYSYQIYLPSSTSHPSHHQPLPCETQFFP